MAIYVLAESCMTLLSQEWSARAGPISLFGPISISPDTMVNGLHDDSLFELCIADIWKRVRHMFLQSFRNVWQAKVNMFGKCSYFTNIHSV